MNIKIIFEDQISGCTDTKITPYSTEKHEKLIKDIVNQTVVSVFNKADQIRYEWVPVSIALIF